MTQKQAKQKSEQLLALKQGGEKLAESGAELRSSGQPKSSLKAKFIAFAVGMLPVLAVGTTTYYFGSQSIDDLAKKESTQHREMLAALSIGTGVTALLAGGLAAVWVDRTIRSAIPPVQKTATPEALEARAERSQILTDAIGHIRTSLKEEDVLEAAVEEVRKVLKCDRVLVYSREETSRGLVVAESVALNLPRALGQTIKDPCFEARYDEKYQNGRIRALDNIYEADLTSCYVEMLKKLAVKANLVAPILNEGKLLGLLVAHQCSESRHWQQWEIDLFAQIAAQVGFALDNARLLARSVGLQQQADTETQWTKFFTDAIQHIRASLTEKDVLKASVREVRRVLECDRVLIYSREESSRGVVVAESVAPGWPRALGKTIKDPCFEARYDEQYQNGRVRAFENIYEANLTSCYIEMLEKLAVKANLVAPILKEDKLLGLLVAHQCSEPRHWQQLEIRWFAQIASQVGFALDNARLLAGSASLQQQVDTEAQWTQFFTDAIQHIRASLKEEDILQAAVEEVRRVLECDRVLVYSREESSRGVVVAESVFPGWPRALGKTIKDPCFEARYDEQYQNGRVRAFENIYQAGLTSCYVEMLEKLAVKANLVAPILNEGKLLGLLVAHQCSEPRNWQQLEIRWFAQMAAQVGFALDNARLLASSNSLQQQAETEVQWTQFFTDAIQHIRASLEEEDVLKATVQEVRRVLECERVVVYSREANSRGIVVAESIAPGWPRALGQTIKDPCFEARYDEQYQNGRVRALENIYEAGLTPCYVEMLEKLAVKANLVAPILNQGKLLGLLVAHQCSAPRHWQQLEIRWFAQIAAQVGFALDNARLLANSDSLQQQADTEAQWTQFFTDAIGHIRASLEEKHVLQAAVEEVRKVLQCERVVVYSREENSRGLVLAESILPGWPRALGQTIKDPCFEAKYDEQYHNGRVRALDNIYEAGLTSCYIEMLEKLAVKANLVAPILNEGKLLGLLVAHQCSEPRNWQQLEIRWFAQIAAQVGFAIDNARLLGRVNQMSQQPLLMSGEHLQEQQLLQQLPKLLRENKTAVNTFSEEAQLQAETFKIVLEQIQGVADSTQSVVASAQQAEIQAQHTLETLQTGQEKVNQTVDNIADIQGTVKEATDKVKHLGNFPQKLSEIVSLINDLAAQLNQQGMNLVIRAGRSEGIDQNSMVLITETVRSSTQQLSTATAEIETLIAQIETEINQVAVAMDASTEQVFGGTELLLETQQQLDRIAGVTSQMNSLVEEIAAAAAQGAQNSTAVSNAVLELASFAKHTYEQSATVTESFSKLTTVVQELQADAAQFKEH